MVKKVFMSFKFPKCKKEFLIFWKKLCNMRPKQKQRKPNGSIVVSGDIGDKNMFEYSRGKIKKAQNLTIVRNKNFVFFGNSQSKFNVTLSLFEDQFNRYPDIVKALMIESIETKLGVFGFQPILENLPKFPIKLKKGKSIKFDLEFQCKGIVPNNTISLVIESQGFEPTVVNIMKQCDIPPKSKNTKNKNSEFIFRILRSLAQFVIYGTIWVVCSYIFFAYILNLFGLGMPIPSFSDVNIF